MTRMLLLAIGVLFFMYRSDVAYDRSPRCRVPATQTLPFLTTVTILIPIPVPSSRPCFLVPDPVPIWPFLIYSIQSSVVDSRRPNPTAAPLSSRCPNPAAAPSSTTVDRDKVTTMQRARHQPLICLATGSPPRHANSTLPLLCLATGSPSATKVVVTCSALQPACRQPLGSPLPALPLPGCIAAVYYLVHNLKGYVIKMEKWNRLFVTIHALPFEVAFKHLEVNDASFRSNSLPLEEDWKHAKVLCDFLANFHQATKILSGTRSYGER
ncbi:hypothetical protein ACLOJK_027748, partial [Asimina triloba]